MKPLKLSITAFGPYVAETVIDFTSLDNSLFLISGKTGAGKTTIFDAMMYALYGITSGKERDPKEMRSQSAREKTVVRFEFRHQEAAYTVIRSISGKPQGTKTEEADLIYPDNRVVSKKREVTSAITDLLGIDGDQFRQIVMLAQGKFRDLLLADSGTRSAILRTIFDTGVFSRFQERLLQEAKEVEQSSKKCREDLAAVISSVQLPESGPADSWLADQIACPVITADAVERTKAGLSSLLETETEDLAALTLRIDETETEKNAVMETIGQAKSTNALLADLAKARTEYDVLTKDKLQYDTLHARVLAARAAEKIAAAESQMRDAVRAADVLNGQIAGARKTLEETVPLQTEAAAALAAAEQDTAAEQQKADAARISEMLPRYADLTAVQADRDAAESRLNEAAETERKKAEDLERAKTAKASSESALQMLKDAAALKVSESAELKTIERQMQQHADLSKALAEYGRHAKKLAAAQTAYTKAADACQETQAVYTRLNRQFLDSQAGILAASLEDGKPCPVCGSVHHPVPAQLAADSVSKEDVEDARAALESAEKTRNEANDKASMLYAQAEEKEHRILADAQTAFGYAGRIEDLQDELDAWFLELSERQSEHAALYEKYAADEQAKTAHERTIADLNAAIPELESASKAAADTRAALESQVNGYRVQLDTIAKTLPFGTETEARNRLQELQAATAAHDAAVRDLRERKDTLAAAVTGAQTTLDNALQSLPETEKRAEELAASFRSALSASFASEEAYRAALEDVPSADAFEAQWSAYGEKVSNYAGQIASLESRTEHMQYTDTDVLQNQADALGAQLKQMQDLKSAIQTRCSLNRKASANLLRLWDLSVDTVRRSSELGRLADAAGGSVSGKDKLDFEKYIQAVYFDEILDAANLRYIEMNGGQYQLRRAESAEDKRAKTGLDIVVCDMVTGMTRRTATLSGGESFMAALSLALGMSDVIQRSAGGIEMQAMFIDEGFDSLDTETLQGVLAMLKRLLVENRLVGIISHVEALNDEIEKKILVEKSGEGKSRVRLIL